jgi:hypothetical protein
MKTRLGALLLVGLAVLTLAIACNGANEVTGLNRETTPPPQVVTPHPRATPNPCRQNPADCD